MRSGQSKTRKLSTVWRQNSLAGSLIAVRQAININELLEGGSERLTRLKGRSRARYLVLTHVLAALPPHLAQTVVSAGVEQGRLTIGVAGSAWASRLRYVAESLRNRVGKAMRTDIQSVRIKVVPPPA
jgi:hypothetical protein